MSTRREFLVGCSSAIAAMAGAKFGSLAFADSRAPGGASDHILVVVFFRGGMDGLNMVAPVDDPNYLAARTPGTMIAATGKTAGLTLENAYAGHDFRLHHAAKGIKELYDSKELALIHASGLTNETRSHFEAQDMVDLGVAEMDKIHYPTGWVDRLISASHGGNGVIPVVSVNGSVPKSLLGNDSAVAMPNPANFTFYGSPEHKKAMEAIYSKNSYLAAAGRQALTTIDVLQAHIQKDAHGKNEPYKPSPGVNYPKNGIGETFSSLAELIKMDVGLQFATIDYGGWDTHQFQGYQFERQSIELGDAMASFWNDVNVYHKRITLVCVSEFGRRVKANNSDGTDHGHGNVMMVLGGHVKGGMMHGTWPGLATHQLDQGADLAVTTDYRWVLAEMAQKMYGIPNPKALFPGLQTVEQVGVFA